MTPPQSWWLRMRSLLLLAPLLVAATPSTQAGFPDKKLGFEGTPLELKKDECVAITVQTQTLAGMAVNLGTAVTVTLGQAPQALGTFYALGGCMNDTLVTVIPAGSVGATVYYKASSYGRVTLTATDGVLGLSPGSSRPISVVNSFTDHLEFTSIVPSRPQPGDRVQVTVTAVDETGRPAFGYAGRVILSSTPPIAGLPIDTAFDPLRDNGVKTFTLTFTELGTYELRIQDQVQTTLVKETALQVALPKVLVTASRKLVGTCDSMTFDLTPVDDQGVPSSEPVPLSFCRPPGSTASIESVSGTALDARSGDCVTGILQGTQHVAWNNPQAADVTFQVRGAEPVGDLTVSWKRLPSPLKSSFTFPGISPTEPTLAAYSQPLPVRFELRDTCNEPLAPVGKTFSFKAPSPLFLTPVAQPSPGVWTAFVSLEGCPSSSVPLIIQPVLDGIVINRALDEPFQLSVKPTCGTPSAELSLHAKDDQTVTGPGDSVDFEVKLENKGTQPFPQGVLKLSTDNLTLLQAQVEGETATVQSSSVVIPPLAAGKTVTVRITAEMPQQQGDSARLTAMYTTAEGTPLTPLQAVILHVAPELSANVGCGSAPATLPSLLAAWGVLLLTASRPWERSRRLRQRERIDRQAPW